MPTLYFYIINGPLMTTNRSQFIFPSQSNLLLSKYLNVEFVLLKIINIDSFKFKLWPLGQGQCI